MDTVQAYISSLRSMPKKYYAQQYLLFRRIGSELSPDKGSLSSTEAQAVRMEIDRLLEAVKEE